MLSSVNSNISDITRMPVQDTKKLKSLEKEIGCSMFAEALAENVEYQHYLDLFYRGCGNRFGCGL